MFMLMASNFSLNCWPGVDQCQLCPWAHMYNNNREDAHQTQSVVVPDINTRELPQDAPFSMAAGSFLEIYNREYAMILYSMIVHHGFIIVHPPPHTHGICHA